MPYLQLDLAGTLGVADRRELARRLGDDYARLMQTTPAVVRVAVRELGEGGVWACGDGDPRPAAVLSCEIRRGRPAAQRAELARGLAAVCAEALGLPAADVTVEITQHDGDDMLVDGEWLPDWSPAEARGQ